MLKSRLVPCLATVALLAECTSAADTSEEHEESAASSYTPGMLNLPDAGDPLDGGVATFAAYSEPAVLDPAQTIVAGSTGGVEMAAIYDVLMRWDGETNTVVPQLAESMEANGDHTEWTLDLRSGVEFSDGTPLDAEAVVWSLERYAEAGADEAMLWSDNVRRTTAVDDDTVLFELERPWPTFDYMLTTGPGMVVARSSDQGGGFTPIGAGPFTLAAQRPSEEIVLDANPGYWGGTPHLEQVRIAFLGDPAAVQDSFDGGSADLAFLRDSDRVEEELEQQTAGMLSMVALGSVAVINATEGRAGHDPRVRQAMALAIDPELISQRAYGGAGVASNAIFPDYSTWHTDVQPLPVDPDEARRLLDEAKADGFDGRISYVDGSDKASRATAVAVEASLEAVGFDVEVKLARTIQEQIITVAVDRDYDLAGWGISWREAGPFGRMFATLHSEGNLSVGMPTGPELDALFADFQVAETTEEQRSVMGRIQEEWNQQVPAVVFGPTSELVAFGERMRGVVGTTNSMVLLHDAWLAQG